MSSEDSEGTLTASKQLGFAFPSPAATIAAGAALPAVCIILFCLRVYARISHDSDKARLGWDDAFVFISLTGLVVMGVCLIYEVKKGVLAYPDSEIQPQNSSYVVPGLKVEQQLNFAFFLGMGVSVGFVKLGILVFFRRLFITHGRNVLDRFTKLVMIVVSLWTLTFLLGFMLVCGSNISVNWGGNSPEAYGCTLKIPIDLGFVISDVILDVVIISLPFPVILRLRMPTHRKLLLTMVFALAWLAVAASITRMVVFDRVLEGHFVETRSSLYLSTTLILYWSIIEAGAMWIAACLPILYGLFMRLAGSELVASIRNALSNLSLSLLNSAKTAFGLNCRKSHEQNTLELVDTETTRHVTKTAST